MGCGVTNVGNSRHTFAASPDNDSFFKEFPTPRHASIFDFRVNDLVRINANRAAGAQHWNCYILKRTHLTNL